MWTWKLESNWRRGVSTIKVWLANRKLIYNIYTQNREKTLAAIHKSNPQDWFKTPAPDLIRGDLTKK